MTIIYACLGGAVGLLLCFLGHKFLKLGKRQNLFILHTFSLDLGDGEEVFIFPDRVVF